MNQFIPDKPAAGKNRPLGILIVAILMILFGLAEVATGFTHNFIGQVSTSTASLSTILGVALGAFYFLGGLFLLTMRRAAACIAIVLLCGDVFGRVGMVLAGLYPVDSFKQTFAIVVGTLIAVFFAIYIAVRMKAFK
ncbi:MAG: hypothetical protein ABSA23_11885 [Anaerolineales bacterium]|jgi:hypothetical protein